MNEFSLDDLLAILPQEQPTKKISEHRLYYDADGVPLHYTMEESEGQYIVVDSDTFAQCRFDIRVIKGKIISLYDLNNKPKMLRRTSNDSNTATTTHIEDMTLITDKDSPHIFWDVPSDA
jgi:hypothetical protein